MERNGFPHTTRRLSRRPLLAAGAVAAFAALALAGCATTAQPAASATKTVTKTATSTPTPAASATKDPDAGGSSPTLRAGQCRTANLTAAAGTAPGGGAAGSSGIRITLTNTGSASCTLQGWPGLSLVGGGNGTQIGQPADFNRQTPHGTVTLAAKGGTAHADATLAEAGNYDAATCTPTPADGFRIYPPGETKALFAPMTGITGCASTGVHLLTEAALQPGT